MNNPINSSLVNRYKDLNLSKIISYGDHFGATQSIKGRISSYLHYSSKYDMRNLTQYYIEWSTVHSTLPLSAQCITDSNLRNTLNSIKKLNLNFNEITTREAALLALAFKNKKEHSIHNIFNLYKGLRKDTNVNCNINAFIAYIKQNMNNDDIKKALLSPSAIQEIAHSIKLIIPEGIVYDSSCAIAGYLYTFFPIIDAAFKTATFALLFESFGAFVASCIVADLSVILVKGLLSGVYNYQNIGILAGAFKGLQEEWNKRVSDDNSFHPIIEAIISSTFIASDWLILDKLEKTAKAGSLLHSLSQSGIKNFCLKYSLMNLFFAFKAQMHQNSFNPLILFQAYLAGIIRGVCKNYLMDSITLPWKLSMASNLQSYTSFLSETYLKEWWIKEIIAKTPIVSTPLWLLKESPEKLISALYFSREVVEILVNGISKTFEIIGISILSPIIQKAYEYKSISIIILAALVYLDPNQLSYYLKNLLVG